MPNHPASRPAPRFVAVSAASILLLGSVVGCADGGDTSGAESTITSPPAAGAETSEAAPSPTDPATSPTDAAASPTEATGPATSSATSTGSASPGATTGAANGQAAVALQAISTAEAGVQGGEVFDLEEETERGERVWSAKVATPDDRQFNLSISQDGSSIVANDEDTSPDDDIRKLRSAEVGVTDAIATASQEAEGEGPLTSLEIDTSDDDVVVWQIDFGGDSGTTVLVDAVSGDVLEVGPDVG